MTVNDVACRTCRRAVGVGCTMMSGRASLPHDSRVADARELARRNGLTFAPPKQVAKLYYPRPSRDARRWKRLTSVSGS